VALLGFRMNYSGVISSLISIPATNLRGFFWGGGGCGVTKTDVKRMPRKISRKRFCLLMNHSRRLLFLFCSYKRFLDSTIIKISRIFSRPALLIFSGIMPVLKKGKLAAKATKQHLHESIYVLITVTEMTFTSFQLQLNTIPLSQ